MRVASLRGFSFLAGETRSPRSELLWRGRTFLSRPSESFRKPRLRPESGAASLARRSAPLPRGRAEHCDCTEGTKHRAKNVSIPPPRRRLRRTATGRRAKRGRATWRPFLLPIRKG